MSPAHTKIVAMMLAKQIRKYERDSSLTIAVPAEVYQQLGIAEEELGNMTTVSNHMIEADTGSLSWLVRHVSPSK